MCVEKKTRVLSARYRDKKNEDIRTLSGFEFRVSPSALRILMRKGLSGNPKTKICFKKSYIDKNGLQTKGELAQMVERSIRIREAPGSMPGFSRGIFLSL